MEAATATSLIRAFSSVTDEMPYSDKGGYITGLTVDNHHNILAVDNQASIVKVFDQMGTFKYAFGDKVLKKPWDIFVTSSGKIAVSDPGEADIKVFSKSGKYLIRSEKGLHLNYPHGMDYHPWTKETAIADRGFSCVYIHDPKGQVQEMLTEQEHEKYCLGSPHYVSFDYTGNLYVTDNEDNSVVAYDTERKHYFTYGHPTDDGMLDNELNNPAGIVVDRFGNILIADTGNCRVHLLDRNGKFKDYVLTWEDGIGEPMAMTLTEEGNLIISEANTGVIKIYSYMHLPYVIDTRVKTPEDGGDNYDIISIESGSTLNSDSDEEEGGQGLRKSPMTQTSSAARDVSHKEFNEQLLAFSASDPKRTNNMPKSVVKQSGMSQWTHVRGEGSAVDYLHSAGVIKGILKNSSKPRFDFFKPQNNTENNSRVSSVASKRGDVVSREAKQNRSTTKQGPASAYSRKSSTLPRSASSPKQHHSAGLHTREQIGLQGTDSVDKQQSHLNTTVYHNRSRSATSSKSSLDSSQNVEKPLVIIDKFKAGTSIPRLNLLERGRRKSRRNTDRSSVSQSVQSHGEHFNDEHSERFHEDMSSKKSEVSIDSLSTIGAPKEGDEMSDEVIYQHFTGDIFDKDLPGFDGNNDNL